MAGITTVLQEEVIQVTVLPGLVPGSSDYDGGNAEIDFEFGGFASTVYTTTEDLGGA